MNETAEYIAKKGYPNELTEKLLGAVFIVESGFHEEDDAFVLLAETESDKKHISQKYNTAYPEYTERIETPLGAWEKSVYIFSDTGEGMIYFAPIGKEENG